MNDKTRIFLVYDETVGGSVIAGDIDQTLEYIKTYLLEMEDGQEQTFDIQRSDMTKTEIEAAPVV